VIDHRRSAGWVVAAKVVTTSAKPSTVRKSQSVKTKMASASLTSTVREASERIQASLSLGALRNSAMKPACS
jgi:hypothetical protein